jgi:ribosomal protein S18 acetylase RimI-like enzyme
MMDNARTLMFEAEQHRQGEFLISTDPARLDVNVIHGFLTNSYWAKGIPREVVVRSVKHSLCFGIYDEIGKKSPLKPKTGLNGAPICESEESPPLATSARSGAPVQAQVGFARVVSDYATVAYLGDVFVLESHRGRGLGKWMMECIMQHPALQGLRRWILLTRDAHGLYSQFGFTPVKSPDRYMELHEPGIYEQNHSAKPKI